MYIQPSWIDAASDHSEWSGGNDQYRGDRSVEAVPTYINGRPNVRAFSDEAIEARRRKKPSSVPLRSRILPQASRVDKLRSEAIELELAFKAGEFTPEEYTLLRSVAFRKLRRAEELLKKAITPVTNPVKIEDEYEQVDVETTYNSRDVDYTHTEVATPCGVSWIDDLSPSNSFKSFLKMSCKVVKTAVHYKHKAATYLITLKEI